MFASSVFSSSDTFAESRLRDCFILMGLVWAFGAIGHFTPLKEWPALFLYVLGSLGLAVYRSGRDPLGWSSFYVTRTNLSQALRWGFSIGMLLFILDIVNTYFYLHRGGEPMGQMEDILVGMNFLYLFPVLIVAEEFLWRGLMLSAFIDRGMNRHLAVGLTTLFFVVNHFAVAPVGLMERGMLAMMALPLGLINGYVVVKTRNVWAGVAIHAISMVSMILDIFLIPKLI